MRDFNHSVNVLVNAYLNDTLKHEDCSACVVGNLCGGSTLWKFLFMTYNGEQKAYLDTPQKELFLESILAHHFVTSEEELLQRAIKVCESTGYTVDELAKIEYAFETCSQVGDKMFNGLMAVVDVLADIHKIDLTTREESKKLFVKV